MLLEAENVSASPRSGCSVGISKSKIHYAPDPPSTGRVLTYILLISDLSLSPVCQDSCQVAKAYGPSIGSDFWGQWLHGRNSLRWTKHAIHAHCHTQTSELYRGNDHPKVIMRPITARRRPWRTCCNCFVAEQTENNYVRSNNEIIIKYCRYYRDIIVSIGGESPSSFPGVSKTWEDNQMGKIATSLQLRPLKMSGTVIFQTTQAGKHLSHPGQSPQRDAGKGGIFRRKRCHLSLY